jgi:hypothetical protein
MSNGADVTKARQSSVPGVTSEGLAVLKRPSPLFSLNNKTQTERLSMNTTQRPVAIVTGASSGIGLGVAQALFGRGLARGGRLPYDQQFEEPYAFT